MAEQLPLPFSNPCAVDGSIAWLAQAWPEDVVLEEVVELAFVSCLDLLFVLMHLSRAETVCLCVNTVASTIAKSNREVCGLQPWSVPGEHRRAVPEVSAICEPVVVERPR